MTLANFDLKNCTIGFCSRAIELICSAILIPFPISSKRKLLDKNIFNLFIFNLFRFFICLARNIFNSFKAYWFFLVKEHSHYSCLRLSSFHCHQVGSVFVKANREYSVLILNVILFSMLLHISIHLEDVLKIIPNI